MDKKVITSESTYTSVKSVESSTFRNLKVATFCVITKVNDNKTLNAQPLVLEKVSTQDGSEQYAKLPEILNVPYKISDNPKEGDFCVCLHLDRGIAGYNKEQLLKGAAKDSGKDKHSLTNCVAICGFLE